MSDQQLVDEHADYLESRLDDYGESDYVEIRKGEAGGVVGLFEYGGPNTYVQPDNVSAGYVYLTVYWGGKEAHRHVKAPATSSLLQYLAP